ncbi:MAG: hypothetical protein HY318_20270, partial [Armatimonadetes bacterium]|nr:hypothetical protein [Armatimonadota bacterium]
MLIADFNREPVGTMPAGGALLGPLVEGTKAAVVEDGPGDRGLRLVTKFLNAPDNSVTLNLVTPLNGKPLYLRVRITGDNSQAGLVFSLSDRTGEYFSYPSVPVAWTGEKIVICRFDRAAQHGEGNDDGIPDYPLQFNGITFKGLRADQTMDLLLDDLSVVVDPNQTVWATLESDQPGGIFPTGAPVVLKVKVANVKRELVGGRIDGEIVDDSGARCLSFGKEFKLDVAKSTVVSVVAPLPQLGLYTVTARVQGGGSGGLSTVVARVPSLPPAGPYRSKLGIGPLPGAQILRPGFGEDCRVISRLGAGWILAEVSWEEIETAPGSLEFGAYESAFKAAHAAGLSVAAFVDHPPSWVVEPAEREAQPPAADELAARLAAFLVKAEQSLGSVIDVWQIRRMPAFGELTTEDFLKFADQCGRGLVQQNPKKPIVLDTTAADLQVLAVAPFPEWLKGIASSPFTSSPQPSEQLESALTNLKSASEATPAKPGYWLQGLRCDDRSPPKRQGRVEPPGQAALLAQSLVMANAEPSVQAVFYSTLHDPAASSGREGTRDGLITADGNPRLGCVAAAITVGLLQGRKFNKRVERGLGLYE